MRKRATISGLHGRFCNTKQLASNPKPVYFGEPSRFESPIQKQYCRRCTILAPSQNDRIIAPPRYSKNQLSRRNNTGEASRGGDSRPAKRALPVRRRCERRLDRRRPERYGTCSARHEPLYRTMKSGAAPIQHLPNNCREAGLGIGSSAQNRIEHSVGVEKGLARVFS